MVVPASQAPAWAAELGHASTARVEGERSRLADDIRRAIKRSHWGLVRFTEAENAGGVMRAEAMLADGRVVTIVLEPGEAETHTVAVRVGRFGDAAVETAYLQVLADTLCDTPKPPRDAKFHLPDNWPESKP